LNINHLRKKNKKENSACPLFSFRYNTRMTTVAQLIAHLQTLPQDAIVECVTEYSYGYSQGTKWKALEIENDIYVRDLRGNKLVLPESPNFNKVFVEIGDI
jgi:hypothetical protein